MVLYTYHHWNAVWSSSMAWKSTSENSILITLRSRVQAIWVYQSTETKTGWTAWPRIDPAKSALDFSLHTYSTGDMVYIRNFNRKSIVDPKWTGPYEILLTTPTSLKVKNRDPWFHMMRLKSAKEKPHNDIPAITTPDSESQKSTEQTYLEPSSDIDE